jgi:hypothetical protein
MSVSWWRRVLYVGDLCPPTEMNFEQWENGACIYRCDICDRHFNNSLDFYTHVERDYKLTAKRYNEKHGCALYKKKSIRCDFPGCYEDVAHDKGKIGAHLARKHNLGMREYYERFVARKKVRVSKY